MVRDAAPNWVLFLSQCSLHHLTCLCSDGLVCWGLGTGRAARHPTDGREYQGRVALTGCACSETSPRLKITVLLISLCVVCFPQGIILCLGSPDHFFCVYVFPSFLMPTPVPACITAHSKSLLRLCICFLVAPKLPMGYFELDQKIPLKTIKMLPPTI